MESTPSRSRLESMAESKFGALREWGPPRIHSIWPEGPATLNGGGGKKDYCRKEERGFHSTLRCSPWWQSRFDPVPLSWPSSNGPETPQTDPAEHTLLPRRASARTPFPPIHTVHHVCSMEHAVMECACCQNTVMYADTYPCYNGHYDGCKRSIAPQGCTWVPALCGTGYISAVSKKLTPASSAWLSNRHDSG